MPLTGNTYGSRVARIGAPVLLALDFGAGAALYEARIISIAEDGTPVIGRLGAEPMTSSQYSFVSTATIEEVEALSQGQWTWPLTTHVIASITSAPATSNVLAVPADGWKQVASVSHYAVGGTSLSVQWTLSADVVTGGKARAVISGGAFGAGQPVGPETAFDALSSAHASSFSPVPLPVTAGTTYTVAIQVQALGDGASVTVNAASSPTTNGARVALVEYH